MLTQSLFMALIMFLLPSGSEAENPWKEKLPAAIQRTRPALQELLDAAWRADEWQVGLHLARLAQRMPDQDAQTRGLIARALWRAGRIEEAERVAEDISKTTRDRVALRTLIGIHLGRADFAPAERLAERLEQLDPLSAEDLYVISAVRISTNRLEGLADLLRKAEKLTDTNNGYPETFVEEAIAGVAEFLDAIGTEPLSQITQYGAAPMPPLVLMNLPSCDVLINGHGPYRVIVDTGGSIMLSLDTAVAEEIGLKSVATASVRGVSGTTETGQALIDELQIGTIKCRRVMTRIFGVREAVMNAADGIIGTGIFAEGRMTLDWTGPQLVVSPSSGEPGAGGVVELRLVGDAKLLCPVRLEGRPAVALLDTGADTVALAPSRLKELFPPDKIRQFNVNVGVGVGSGELPQISITGGVDLVLGGREFENYGGIGLDALDTTLGPIIGVQSDILIGMPTFRQMKSCTVDFPRCKLWIDWLER